VIEKVTPKFDLSEKVIIGGTQGIGKISGIHYTKKQKHIFYDVSIENENGVVSTFTKYENELEKIK